MATAGQRQVMGTPMLAVVCDAVPRPAPLPGSRRRPASPSRASLDWKAKGCSSERSLCVQRGVDTERDVDWGILRTRNRDGADRGDAIPTHSRQLLAGGGGVRSPDARRAHGATSVHGVSGR